MKELSPLAARPSNHASRAVAHALQQVLAAQAVQSRMLSYRSSHRAVVGAVAIPAGALHMLAGAK